MSITNLQETFNNFKYVSDDYNEDLKSIALAESLTSENVIESIRSDNSALNLDMEMPFLFNDINFERTRAFIKEEEDDNISLLNDNNAEIDMNTSTFSIFDSESTTLESTDGNKYFLKNVTSNSESLSVCLIIDIIDGRIQHCSGHSEKQRPLSQLIGV